MSGPSALLVSQFPDRFSLITGMGTWWQVAIFLGACLFVAVMLTIGWHTRTACIFAFVGVASGYAHDRPKVCSSCSA